MRLPSRLALAGSPGPIGRGFFCCLVSTGKAFFACFGWVPRTPRAKKGTGEPLWVVSEGNLFPAKKGTPPKSRFFFWGGVQRKATAHGLVSRGRAFLGSKGHLSHSQFVLFGTSVTFWLGQPHVSHLFWPINPAKRSFGVGLKIGRSQNSRIPFGKTTAPTLLVFGLDLLKVVHT